ncbi:uncharacterized protein, partial [Drosophila pseudoobscura]|uniref:Uncharacterized protein n=1 Tax=Drosophila pseudoobscura pseudoobscura TaxID=46245 RepID=A0A6I8VPJ5_DROPS
LIIGEGLNRSQILNQNHVHAARSKHQNARTSPHSYDGASRQYSQSDEPRRERATHASSVIIRVNIQANVLHYVSYSDVVFYYGIRGALLRCTVQTGTKYALYWLKDNEYLLILEPYDTSTVAGISGLGGGLLSTPFAKVAIVRQADLTRRPFLQRNYRDPWKALKCMYGKGGMSFLFSGCELHAFTTGAVAALYAPVHDWVSDMLLKLHRIRDEDWVIDLMAMTITSSIISLILTPVEAVKTVVMNSCYKKFPSKTHLCLKII